MPRQQKQVDYHAGGVHAQRLLHRIGDQLAEDMLRQRLAVDIGHVRSQHQRWLLLAGNLLEVPRLTHSQLDGVGVGLDDRLNGARQVFDACQKRRLIEKSVVDGDVETLAIGCKESIQSRLDAQLGTLLSRR